MLQRKIFLTTALVLFVNLGLVSPVFSQNEPQKQEQGAQNNADSDKKTVSSEVKKEENASKKDENEKKQGKEVKKDTTPADGDKDKLKAESKKTAADNKQGDQKKSQAADKPQAEKAAPADSDADKTAADEKIATITAEGDFVVPTFLMPAASDADKEALAILEDPQVILGNVPAPAPQEPVKKVVVDEKTKTIRELPVMKITQTELTPVSEQMAVERFLTGKTTKTTKMYQEALARQKQKELAAEGIEVSIEQILADEALKGANATQLAAAADSHDGQNKTVKDKKRLLLPLRPLPPKEEPEEDLSDTKPLFKILSSEMADQALEDAKQKTRSTILLPQDIKVTFYPRSAEFSGQTIKWIKAFSLQALNDPRYIIEIRLSNKEPVVQQKRLFVVQRLLMNSGLSAHQIVVDYVDRPADSLILRMVQRLEDVSVKKETFKNGKIKQSETINW